MSADGLAVERRGSGSPLVLVHGFTQTGRSWSAVADDLATDHEVLTVDLPGHGGSRGVQVDLSNGAALLGEAGGRATYVGYSMGAPLCLHLALSRPDIVQRLVLISGTAGLEDAAARTARRAADDEMAASIERDGVDAFLTRWMAQSLFVTLPAPAADLDERVRNTAGGLAASLRLAGTGTQEPLWGRLGELPMPVLVVVGALDPKFRALGERLASLTPNATLVMVAGSGHSVPLERPVELAGIVRRWIAARC